MIEWIGKCLSPLDSVLADGKTYTASTRLRKSGFQNKSSRLWFDAINLQCHENWDIRD
jgi:hypothetical protein